MSKELIRLVNCRMDFDGETVLDSINIYFNDSEFLTLLGPSGCGKTTTGRTLLRLYEPTDGTIIYDGKVLFDKKEKIAVDMLPYRRRMQIVFQDPYASLDPRMTIGDIVGEGIDIHHLCANAKERHDKIISLLERVGLNSEHANRYPHEFSGGQRQRVGIARAFVSSPKVIFADEPTGNLDSRTSKQVLYRMLEMSKNSGVTFVMVTHEPELAECADRIVTILDGKVCSNVVQDEETKKKNRDALFADLEGNLDIGGEAAKEQKK